MKKRVTVCLSLPEDMIKRLKATAKNRGDISHTIEKALHTYWNEVERNPDYDLKELSLLFHAYKNSAMLTYTKAFEFWKKLQYLKDTSDPDRYKALEHEIEKYILGDGNE